MKLNTDKTCLFSSLRGELGLRSFKNILVIGEKKAFNELAEIIAMAIEANAIMKEMFKIGHSNPTALSDNMLKIRTLEKESDEIAFRYGEHITSGAVNPNTIDILIECGHVADNIVDLYYYLSREQYRMSKTTMKLIANNEAEWTSFYDEMLELASKSLVRLKCVLNTADMNEMLECRKHIESFEESGDDIKDIGLDKLYSLAPRLHFIEFYHYGELLHKCDDILDSCEDLSDLVVSAVTSLLK
jgi:uncharacterized protein Yka (UPF0111/DUF47 family)